MQVHRRQYCWLTGGYTPDPVTATALASMPRVVDKGRWTPRHLHWELLGMHLPRRDGLRCLLPAFYLGTQGLWTCACCVGLLHELVQL